MTERLLVFETANAWTLLAGAALVVVAGWLAWRGLKGFHPGRSLVLLILRGMGLVCLAGLLLSPAIQHRRLRPLPGRVAILIDGSKSMALPDGESTRMSRVSEFLDRQQAALTRLGQDWRLDVFRFADKLSRETDGVKAPEPVGERTDIAGALGELRSLDPSGLVGLWLISDGADTESLQSLDDGENLPERLRETLRALRVPVNTIAVGSDAEFVDLAILDVVTDELAFVRNAVEVQVRLLWQGAQKTVVPLTLEQDGRNLHSVNAELEPGRPGTFVLKFVPDRVGKHVYTVRVPPLPGEVILANNTQRFITRTIRDKIRVLHLVGRPGWDERFLRGMLKRNPNLDLVSFFILRTNSDMPGTMSNDELSLIPFPVDQLFGSELATFDIVIFQNFNHGPYRVAYYLSHVRDYVREGGALLMLGGDLSFGAGGYAGTALEEVLPVRLQPGYDVQLQSFRPLPAAGLDDHPLLQLGVKRLWEQLPPVASFNRVEALFPGAQAILVHPFERTSPMAADQAVPAPILALREVGRGRTAALLTDGSWRWNFQYAGGGGSTRPYYRFFNNLLRWLIHDPGLQPVQLSADRARYGLSDPIRLRLHWPERAGKTAWLKVRPLGGQVIERRPVTLDASGDALVKLEPLAPGAYQGLLLGDRDSDKPLSSDALVVQGIGAEQRNPRPRPGLLRKIAAETSGKAETLASADLTRLEIAKQRRYRVEASSSRPLVSHFWVLVLLVSVLALEWWLRRRWGLA